MSVFGSGKNHIKPKIINGYVLSGIHPLTDFGYKRSCVVQLYKSPTNYLFGLLGTVDFTTIFDIQRSPKTKLYHYQNVANISVCI